MQICMHTRKFLSLYLTQLSALYFQFPVSPVSGPGSPSRWALPDFNGSKEFSNSQKWVTILIAILIRKRLWKSKEMVLIRSSGQGVTFTINHMVWQTLVQSANKSPGTFSGSIFISVQGPCSRMKNVWQVRTPTVLKEKATASAPALVLGINKFWTSFWHQHTFNWSQIAAD